MRSFSFLVPARYRSPMARTNSTRVSTLIFFAIAASSNQPPWVADFVRQRPPLGNVPSEAIRPAKVIVADHLPVRRRPTAMRRGSNGGGWPSGRRNGPKSSAKLLAAAFAEVTQRRASTAAAMAPGQGRRHVRISRPLAAKIPLCSARCRGRRSKRDRGFHVGIVRLAPRERLADDVAAEDVAVVGMER